LFFVKFTINKTNTGLIYLQVQVPFVEILLPMRILEARKLAKDLEAMVSPQKSYDLEVEPGDEDFLKKDDTHVESSSRGLILHRITDGSVVKITFPADDKLFDLKEYIDKALSKILGQEKKTLQV